MREQKEKVRVPAYKMGLAELYLLLRIRMEQTGRKSINGVKKAFFEPDTYQNHNKLLKSLVKKKLLEEQDGSKDALSNAPERNESGFIVPKTIG